MRDFAIISKICWFPMSLIRKSVTRSLEPSEKGLKFLREEGGGFITKREILTFSSLSRKIEIFGFSAMIVEAFGWKKSFPPVPSEVFSIPGNSFEIWRE